MPDEKKLQDADPKPAERAARNPEPVKAASAGTPIGEAGDPAVLQLLAEAETARLNGDEDRKNALHDEIRELGYSVG